MLQQNLIHQHRNIVTNIAEFFLPFNKTACSFLSISFDQFALSWNTHVCMQKNILQSNSIYFKVLL